MYTFIKLGGSVITNKAGREAADLPLIARLCAEISAARAVNPDLSLILAHGSGSFGHHYAARYGVHRGVPPEGSFLGFAYTAAAALRLNRIVVDQAVAAGLPALSLQPSASLRTRSGAIQHWETATVATALSHGLIPVIHGDVAFDDAQGSAIVSTETLLEHLALATPLRPARVILVGESAVFTADPRIDPLAERIPQIDGQNIEQVLSGAGGSHAVDVTGGMRSKLELIWRLVQHVPALEVRLIGPDPGLLQAALSGTPRDSGTLVRR